MFGIYLFLGKTIIYAAAAAGRLVTSTYLINKGANITDPDYYGEQTIVSFQF